jgi:hypothetical protein
MRQTEQPDHDAIAARAYALYVDRGRKPGHALRDWLDAEAELRGEIPPPEEPATQDKPPSTDAVTEASWESFPASDAPSWRSGTT